MSDNPADSLRRELEAAFAKAWFESSDTDLVDAIWPLIAAALEAARADERERLQRENQELRAEVEAEREKCPMALIHYGPPEHEHQWVNRGVQGMGLDFIGKKCSVCGVSDGD